jgi:competence protein ComEC
VALHGLYDPAALFLLTALDVGMGYWCSSLSFLSEHSLYLPPRSLDVAQLLLVVLSVLLLAAPKGLGFRILVPCLILPSLIPVKPVPLEGEARVAVLDVGQGLAILVQTKTHAMLYDTGGLAWGRFSPAVNIILPYLGGHSIDHLDAVLLSHGDTDHSGGLEVVHEAFPLAEIYAGSPVAGFSGHTRICQKGMSWEWDQVQFDVLSGSGDWKESNERSCVIRIKASGQSLLLTGDIGRKAELELIRTEPWLRADILLLPHHGSKHSSSPEFLAKVAPQYVLVSSGYRNRFGHPAPETLDRIKKQGAEWFNTADDGTLSFILGDRFSGINRYRYTHNRYWWR